MPTTIIHATIFLVN